MSDYVGVLCPYCGKPFTADDDIAVCPECGTPHHRDCYREHGECANLTLHSASFEWERIPEPERKPEKPEIKYICPRCKSVISRDEMFCPHCGMPVPQTLPEVSEEKMQELQERMNEGSLQGTTAMYSLNSTDKIDGVTLADLMSYLKNPSYIIAICRQEISGKRAVFSLPALFSPTLFFLYNKVWPEGIITMIVSLILAIPDGMIVLYRLTNSTVFNVPLATWDSLSSACSVINVLFNLFFAFFGIYFLRKNAVKKITRLRSISKDENEFQVLLKKHAPPSKAVIAFIGIYIALLIFSLFYL